MYLRQPTVLSWVFLIALLMSVLMVSGCVTIPAPTAASNTAHGQTPASLQSFGLIVRPVGNPDPTPPVKYEDFLQKVGGLELTYVRTLASQAYVFTTEPTTRANLQLTIQRLMSHPYIRYAEEDKVMKIAR
ncbi:MAG: hypothetical protein ACWA5U_03395 [bacterium]